MPSPPYKFDDLAVRAGQPIRAALSARWYATLVRLLRATCPVVAEGGYLNIEYAETGAFIETTRPIPAYRLVRVGAGGIAARNASTGAPGTATVTVYKTQNTGSGPLVVLTATTETAVNDIKVAVPANVDAKCIEQDGVLIILGWECP